MTIPWYFWLPLIGFILDHRCLIFSLFDKGEKP
jgi:hypothetical protein